jgi:hypothetical protein
MTRSSRRLDPPQAPDNQPSVGCGYEVGPPKLRSFLGTRRLENVKPPKLRLSSRFEVTSGQLRTFARLKDSRSYVSAQLRRFKHG